MKKILPILLLTVIPNVSICLASEISGSVRTVFGPLQNAVVYIEKIDGETFLPSVEPAVLSQTNLSFIPHVLPIIVGTTVNFPNHDVLRHNVFSPSSFKKFDLGTYLPDSSKSIIFDKPGVVSLLCHVHHEMSAFILVLETPYFSVTDQNGDFTLRDVPPGKYKLTVWHEPKKTSTKEVIVPISGEVIVNYTIY